MSGAAEKSAGARGGSLAKAVFGGAGLLAAAGVANKLISLVSAPILTKALGPSPYGVLSLVGTITTFATTVALLGVDMSYSRFFFGQDPEEGNAVERFCWRFGLASGCAVSSVAGLLWWLGGERLGLPRGLAFLVSGWIFLAVLNVLATTRQRLKGSYLRIAAAIATAGAVGAAVAILIALSWRTDAWALVVGAASGVAAGSAVAGLPPAQFLLAASGLSRKRRWEVMRLGIAGAVTAPMFWVMNSADRWFIGMWAGQGPLGVYAFAAGIGMIGLMANSAVNLAWFPEMSRSYEASREEAPARIGRLWARLAAGLMVVWLTVAAAGGDVIRLVAHPRFHEGAAYVPWLAGAVFFYGIANLANTGLVLRKDMAPAAAWWAVAAAANVGLNYLLVGRIGPAGSALAACASFALLAACVTRSAQARFPLPLPWVRLAAASAATLAAGVVMAPPWASSPALSLFLKFPVGAACALGLMRISAPDWTARLLRGDLALRLRGDTGGDS